jgi:hypothetical protein
VQDVNILAINTLQQLTQFVALWDRLQVVHLNLNTSDHIEWTLNTNGDYSTKSAYMVQFHGSINTELDTLIWKSWAPAKCKFSAWLAVQIAFGQQIAWLEEDGQTNVYVLFVIPQMNH